MADGIESTLKNARAVLDDLLADSATLARINQAGRTLADCLGTGGKIMICGNGGSACDAAHFAEELTGRFRADRLPLAAIACTDPGHITCTANDYGFEHVFARWVQALGRKGDVLIVLSTSGNSSNILRTLDAGKQAGMHVIGLLGKAGGLAAPLCDTPIIVPGGTSDRIQELHMLVLHGWVEAIEARLFTPSSPGGR